MKVTFVVPAFNLLQEGYGTSSKNLGGNLPNLGVCILAAVLERDGHKVQIIDAEAGQIDNHEILKRINHFETDIVGITITNAHYESMKKLINDIKYFQGPIVVGGPHATCFPLQIMKENPRIDFLAVGEGEETIKHLVEDNKNPDKIDGICYREKDKIKMTQPRAPIKNLDDISRPALHLLDMKLYSPLPDQYKKLPAISWITSRGCTWRKCTFCFESNIHAQTYRRQSPKRVIKDIIWLQKHYGIQEIDFLDDEFFINENWIKEFCSLLDNDMIRLSWSGYARADHVTKEMLWQAKFNGCWGIYMGIESGNQDLLDTINKGITLEQVRKVCEWCSEIELEVRGSFMLGLPGETPEKAQKTIDFSKELRLATAAFHLTYPEAGTKLYDIAMRQGRFINQDRWTKRTKVSYLPEGYSSPDELEMMQKKAFRQFYFRPWYITKRFLKMRNLQDLQRELRGFKFLKGIVKNS